MKKIVRVATLLVVMSMFNCAMGERFWFGAVLFKDVLQETPQEYVILGIHDDKKDMIAVRVPSAAYIISTDESNTVFSMRDHQGICRIYRLNGEEIQVLEDWKEFYCDASDIVALYNSRVYYLDRRENEVHIRDKAGNECVLNLPKDDTATATCEVSISPHGDIICSNGDKIWLLAEGDSQCILTTRNLEVDQPQGRCFARLGKSAIQTDDATILFLVEYVQEDNPRVSELWLYQYDLASGGFSPFKDAKDMEVILYGRTAYGRMYFDDKENQIMFMTGTDDSWTHEPTAFDQVTRVSLWDGTITMGQPLGEINMPEYTYRKYVDYFCVGLNMTNM